MSNATLSANPARRESENLLALVAGFAVRFFSAVRCANDIERGRNPRATDLALLGIKEPLTVPKRHG